MSGPLEPMSEDLRALLELERQRPEPPAEVLAGLASKIDARLDWADWEGADDRVPPAPGPAAPRASSFPRELAAHWKLALASAALGSILTVGVYQAAEPAPPAAVLEDPSPPAKAVLPPPAPKDVSLPSAPPAVAAPMPVRAPPAKPRAPAAAVSKSPSPAPDDDGLSRERAILEVARAAVARGNFAEARQALARHQATAAQGLLAEERDSLVIQLFLLEGDRATAEREFQSFQQRYPSSLMTSGLKSALESTPVPPP